MAVLGSLCVLAAPAAAQAGTYRVAQCTAGNQAAPDYLIDDESNGGYTFWDDCSTTGGRLGIATNGVLPRSGAVTRWVFTAPAGTKIVAVDTEAALTTGAGNEGSLFVNDPSTLETFGSGGTGGWQTYSWSGSGKDWFKSQLYCNRPICDGSASVYYTQIRNMNVRLSDTSTPTVTPDTSTGLFSPGAKTGTQNAGVAGADSVGGGIQELSIAVNGTTVGTQDYTSSGCTLLPDNLRAKRPAACLAAETKSFSLNTAASPFHEGSNSVQSCSEDYAENRVGNRTCDTRSVVVDNRPPDTIITSGPSGATVDDTPTFTFTADEPSTFRCWLEGIEVTYTPCTSAKTYGRLGNGTYTFHVKAVDQDGNREDPTPAAQTFTVDVPINRCENPTVTAYDGYAGTTYVSLKAKADLDRANVCLRLDNRQGVLESGAFQVDIPSASAAPPSVDPGGGGDCLSAGGTDASPPVTIGNPGEMTYARIDVSTYAGPGESWVCLTVDGANPVSERVIVPTPGGSVAPPSFTPDPASEPTPNPVPPPAGYPSARCEETAGGTKDPIANGDTPAGHLYAYERRTSNTAQLCIRLAGAGTVGGELKVDASGSLVPPVITISTDITPCSSNVISAGSTAQISRSPGTNPASICVQAGSTTERLTVDPGGTGTAIVGFTPDPDIAP